VSWKGKLVKQLFLMPSECDYLDKDLQRRLFAQVDFSSDDKLKHFLLGEHIDNEGDATSERVKRRSGFKLVLDEVLNMQRQMQGTSPRQRVYRMLQARLEDMKQVSFGLAVFMNLTMLISLEVAADYYCDDGTPNSSLNGAHYISFMGKCFVYMGEFSLDASDNSWLFKLENLMSVCGIFQLALSSVIVFLLLGKELPFLRSQMDRLKFGYKKTTIMTSLYSLSEELKVVRSEESAAEMSALDGVNSSYKYFLAFFGLLVMLYIRYGSEVFVGYTTFLLPALFIYPVLRYLEGRRRLWAMPSSAFRLYYCIIYDVLLDRDNVYIQFYVVYVIFAALGVCLQYHLLYAFHLADVIIMSPILQNVVRAVTSSAAQLSMTLLMGVFAVYFFAAMGFFMLQGEFVDTQTGRNDCQSLFLCFGTILHYGLMR
jgi:hypothetical protein